MNAEPEAQRPADDDFVERLTAELDRYADAPRPVAESGEPVGADGAGALAVSTMLRAPQTWTGPPAGLRDSILAAARAQAPAAPAVAAPSTAPAEPVAAPSTLPAEPVAAPAPAPAEPRPVRRPSRGIGWRARWGRLTWAIPAVAVAAALFTAGVIAVDRSLEPRAPRGVTYAVTGTQAMPGVTGDLSVADTGTGVSVVARFHRLPPAAPGTYYAAWLSGPHGVVPLGSFHWHHGGTDVTMWSGVEVKDYPLFMITVQNEGDPPGPSTVVIMTAKLA